MCHWLFLVEIMNKHAVRARIVVQENVVVRGDLRSVKASAGQLAHPVVLIGVRSVVPEPAARIIYVHPIEIGNFIGA